MNAAAIILYDKDGKLLIQKRSKNAKKLPGYWSFFGGAVEKNENPISAIKREALEEINYSLDNPMLIAKEQIKGDGNKFFFIEKYSNKKKLRLKEGEDMKWALPQEIKKLKFAPHHRKIIQSVTNFLNKKKLDD